MNSRTCARSSARSAAFSARLLAGLQPVLEEVAEACGRLCEADHGALWLLEDGLLHVGTHHGEPEGAQYDLEHPHPVDRTTAAGRAAPVETSAYFVVAEALTNAAKHTYSSHVQVAVRVEEGAVSVEVRDDGIGGADPSVGSGLPGLADRVNALGGRLEIESPAGEGTTVRARIALTAPEISRGAVRSGPRMNARRRGASPVT